MEVVQQVCGRAGWYGGRWVFRCSRHVVEQVRLGVGRPGNVLGLLWWTFEAAPLIDAAA